ncbi:MAG: hypothetical protein Pg6B_09740 [Candidatus Azobacteroides pseudotrichonymphae]|jgi:hypothetical protein|nr:MAG: hypothetical protein Pg6B_09740 [Candidatus Azobacteroides pseudotrichonymphae]
MYFTQKKYYRQRFLVETIFFLRSGCVVDFSKIKLKKNAKQYLNAKFKVLTSYLY